MIYSMTGFGSARAEAPNLAVLVEIKSVNHRYLDVHIKIPGEYQNFENIVRQKISAASNAEGWMCSSGSITSAKTSELDVNHELIRAYVEMMSGSEANTSDYKAN